MELISQWETAHKQKTKQLFFLQKTKTKNFSTQINSLERFERRVGGQARTQAVDIDDLVAKKAEDNVNIKKLSA